MTAVSKLYVKCNNCKYKNVCDNKRMVACNLAEINNTNVVQCTTRKMIRRS